MSDFFDYFNQLSHREQATRKGGVEHLIEFLLSDSSQDLKYRNSTAFEYCLQRLVKGLSAYTSPTLHGFATTLTCVLDSIDGIIPHAYDLIEKHLVSPPHANSSEVKGYRVGQLLALSALSRSSNFPATESGLKLAIIKRISSFLQQDAYLRTASAQVISDYISSITEEELEQLLLLITEFLKSSNLQSCSPDTLSIIFALAKSFPTSELTADLLPSAQISSLNAAEHLPIITDILLTTVSSSNQALHPSLLFAMDYYLSTEIFHSFWTHLVEEGTFELELSKKCIVLDLLIHTIRCDPLLQHVFSVLSPRVISFLKSAIHTSKEPLHSRGVNTAKSLISLIHNRTIAQDIITTLKLFLFSQNVSQDLASLYNEADCGSNHQSADTLLLMHSLCKHILEGRTLISYPPLFTPLSATASPLLASQEYTLSLLAHLSKLPECMDSQGEEALIKFLVTHSYFHMMKSSKSFFPPSIQLSTELSDETREKCQQTLLLILTDFLPKDTRRTSYLPQLGFVVKWFISLLGKSKHVRVLSQRYDSDMLHLIRRVYALTLDLEKAMEEEGGGEAVARTRSLLLTFIHYHSIILLNKPRNSTKNTLSILLECYSTVSQAAIDTAVLENKCIHDLMSEILNTLSHNSHLSRTLSDILFRSLIPYMTADALLLLANAAFVSSASSEDEGEDSESGEVSGSESDVASGVDSSDSEHEVEEGEMSREERDLRFRLEVGSALGEGEAELSDVESLDMDQDEERLKKIDFALAQLFRKKLKTENPTRVRRQKEVSSLHFRTRVLALLQTFIEKRADSPLLLLLLVPASECLLIISKKRELAELCNKLSSLYTHKLCRAKYKLTDNTTTPSDLCTLLKRLFHLALSAHSIHLARTLSEGIGLLLKIMRRADMLVECTGNLTENLEEYLAFFAAKKNGYQWNLPFLKLIEFAPHIACDLIPKLLELITSNAYKFQIRKCEEILQNIIQSPDCGEHIRIYLSQLHSFYSHRLASIPTIEKSSYCQTSLNFSLSYCQLLARSRHEGGDVESSCEEVERLVEELSATDRVTRSQRLSRICSSLSDALAGEGKGSRGSRKRNRRSRNISSQKKIKFSLAS